MKQAEYTEKSKRDATIQLRISTTEKQLVEQQAARKKMDVSTFIRSNLPLKRSYQRLVKRSKVAENKLLMAQKEEDNSKTSLLLRRLDARQTSPYTPQQQYRQYLETQGLTPPKDPLNRQPTATVKHALIPTSDERVEIQIKTLFFIQQTVLKLADYVGDINRQTNPEERHQLAYEANGLLSNLYDKFYDHDR